MYAGGSAFSGGGGVGGTGGWVPGIVPSNIYSMSKIIGSAQGMPSMEERMASPDMYNPEPYLLNNKYAEDENMRVMGAFGDYMYYNPEGTEGQDQYVWRDVWDYQQNQASQEKEQSYMAGLKKLMGYSNIANAFASRGMGPGSGSYYGAAGEFGQPATRGGGYEDMIQSLISQIPGGQESIGY